MNQAPTCQNNRNYFIINILTIREKVYKSLSQKRNVIKECNVKECMGILFTLW